MKLLIAIPALNEEESIGNTIQRSLDARTYICSNSPVSEVEITVISDGSTDGTIEIASSYGDRIRLIRFPVNRGYGAAIQEAWRQSDAEILGLMDADGTCEPKFFAPLCERLLDADADVVMGCRLHPQSKMPLIRRMANMVLAAILTALSLRRVRDTASGMRVVRRSALSHLLPLPDGLHFTPAMTARSLLSDSVKSVEIDMPYYERTGKSKLHIAQDGPRFLKIVLQAAFLYRPSRFFGGAAGALFLIAGCLMIRPMIWYTAHHEVLPWGVNRFLISYLCGISGCLFFCGNYLTDRMAAIWLADEICGWKHKSVSSIFQSQWFWGVPAFCFAVSLAVSGMFGPSNGGTYELWVRCMAAAFFVSIALTLTVTRILDLYLEMLVERWRYLRFPPPADLVQAGSALAAETGGASSQTELINRPAARGINA